MVNRSGVGPALARSRGLLLLVLLVAGGAALLRHAAATVPPNLRPSSPAQAQAVFAHLPIGFEPNQGQAAAPVKFLAHGSGFGLHLMSSKAVLTLPRASKAGLKQVPLEMQLAGSNGEGEIVGADRLPGHSNYFIGNDSTKWLHNV